MTKRGLAIVGLGAVLALSAAGCDAIRGLIEPQWEPFDVNGERGALHFGLNPFDFKKDLPEHVRIERREHRTVTKPGGAKEEEERERQIQVVLARCIPASICDAAPHSTDTREVVVTPRIIGSAELEVTVAVDGQENMKDRIQIAVGP